MLHTAQDIFLLASLRCNAQVGMDKGKALQPTVWNRHLKYVAASAGTAVAGSLAGAASTPNETEQSLAGAFDGAAPGAKLVFFDLGNVGSELQNMRFEDEIFPHSYRAGARLHSLSLSWGFLSDSYSMAMLTDEFHVDHPDFLVLAAAGNDGGRNHLTVSPSFGKNVVSVGATENARESWAAHGKPQMVLETISGDPLAVVTSDTGVRILDKLPSLFVLVEASPADACSTFVGDHYNLTAVLIKTGGCSAETKANNAKEAGAVTIFLYDDTPGGVTGAPGAESRHALLDPLRSSISDPEIRTFVEIAFWMIQNLGLTGKQMLENLFKTFATKVWGEVGGMSGAVGALLATIIVLAIFHAVPLMIAGVALSTVAQYTTIAVAFDLAVSQAVGLAVDMSIDIINTEWKDYVAEQRMLDATNTPNKETLQAELDGTYWAFAPFKSRIPGLRRRLLETPPSPTSFLVTPPVTVPWITPDPPLQKPTLSQIARILNTTLLGVNMTLVKVRHSTSTDNLLNGVDVLAYFSARGPARGHRIKPDVLCPGHKIITVKTDWDTSTNQVAVSALDLHTARVFEKVIRKTEIYLFAVG